MKSLQKIFCNFICSFIPYTPWRRKVRSFLSPYAPDKLLIYFSKKYLDKIKIPSKFNDGTKSNYIFQCWLQGYDDAPEIVKKCMQSVKLFNPDKKIILIDKNNYSKWVKLPDFIIDKWNRGIISNTHFSDVLRLALLAEYGGYWVDATCLFTSKIPLQIEREHFFMFHANYDGYPFKYTLIQNCFIHANRGNTLITLWRDILFEYWKVENKALQYFFAHLLFITLLKNPRCYSEYQKMPVIFQIPTHRLLEVLYDDFDSGNLKNIFKESFVHKLTYKYDKKKMKSATDSYLMFLENNDLDYILKFSPR